MSNSLANSPVAFHISMNVSDINRSVDFFSQVFGVPPTKHRGDYAKFELQNPPITFSLEPGVPAERGALNHAGFKLQSAEELVELQRRLEMAGIHSEREEGVECCYARQTKFWLHDPDGTLWEMYVLQGDLEHRGNGQDTSAVLGQLREQESSAPRVLSCALNGGTQEKLRWSHRLGNPLNIPGDIAFGSLDEVSLQGTLNGEGASPRTAEILKDVADRLKPGGRLALHCLTSDRHVDEVPAFPGPASVVKSVPCLNSLMDQLAAAGYIDIRLTKYAARPCFLINDAEFRETMIEAWKHPTPAHDCVSVVYKGPFPEIKLDSGATLSRGIRAEVPRQVAQKLMASSVADSFVVLETATSHVSCTR